ncbi:hypothetical protein IQ265_23260 [Nodosilinea sp. LEGE 06152]|uniref:hypothetical protein n=1 Tax=Nodosilinea sp. LEGE 06152 TaxID=2777966 RepID=UPI00187E60AC|nr:hypothetical protein [Nodosilinea sp. LEGE 06152]MBE9159731.1 hypothetical protein [Nodosilinea sp. LEGE 06152]
MDEYLETLRIEGRHEEADEYEKYRQEQNKAVQEWASKLRAEGKEVKYLKDGGIEIQL